MEQIFWEELANILLEARLTTHGVYDTIRFLLDCGYSVEELLKLHFTKEDIMVCEEEAEKND